MTCNLDKIQLKGFVCSHCNYTTYDPQKIHDHILNKHRRIPVDIEGL